MKTYRYSSYQCTASAMEDFRKELILQKKNRVLGRGYYFIGIISVWNCLLLEGIQVLIVRWGIV